LKHDTSHQWIYYSGIRHCISCKTFATSAAAARKSVSEECPGLCPKIAHLITDPRGHLLCGTETSEGDGIFFCARCGAYAISTPKALRLECKGTAKRLSAGHYTLQRLVAGKHPVHACRTATTGIAVPLDAALSREQREELEEKLEQLSRHRQRPQRNPDSCPKRDTQVRPLPRDAELPLAASATCSELSAAGARLAALQQRIRQKHLAAG